VVGSTADSATRSGRTGNAPAWAAPAGIGAQTQYFHKLGSTTDMANWRLPPLPASTGPGPACKLQNSNINCQPQHQRPTQCAQRARHRYEFLPADCCCSGFSVFHTVCAGRNRRGGRGTQRADPRAATVCSSAPPWPGTLALQLLRCASRRLPVGGAGAVLRPGVCHQTIKTSDPLSGHCCRPIGPCHSSHPAAPAARRTATRARNSLMAPAHHCCVAWMTP
jgi:hypothetical protein